jgi:hypothetical protein
VKKSALLKAPVATTEMLEALIEGLAFVKSPARKAVVVKTLMTRLRISDPAVAEEGYRHLQTDLDTSLYPPVQGLLNLQRFMRAYNPRLAEVKVADLIDTSILDRLVQTGFVDDVFRRYGLKEH